MGAKPNKCLQMRLKHSFAVSTGGLTAYSALGYDELTGQRKRYRIVDRERLLDRTGFSTMDEFVRFYMESIEQALAGGQSQRQAWWTEAVAVGSEDFINEAAQTCTYRRSMDKHAITIPGQEYTWFVCEPTVAYTVDSRQKNGC